MISEVQTWTARVSDGDERAELLIDTTWGKKFLDQDALLELKRGALTLLERPPFGVDAIELSSDRVYRCPAALEFATLDSIEKDLVIDELVYVANSGVGYGHCSPVLIATFLQNSRGACLTGLAYARIMQGRAPVLLVKLDPAGKREPTFLQWKDEAARFNIPTGRLIS